MAGEAGRHARTVADPDSFVNPLDHSGVRVFFAQSA
jgi:hypothetical protein